MVRICIGEVCVRSRWLDGTRLGGQALNIKSIHVVARGMVLGNVQRLEIVVRRFDFGAFDDAEADGAKDALQLFVRLANHVARADCALDARQREINFVAELRGLFRGGF